MSYKTVINPNEDSSAGANSDQKAADLIREKLIRIYDTEPDAKKEAEEVRLITPTSKHQEYMRSLIDSGKDIATIQTEWHNYYINLNEANKREVWQEFYASNQNVKQPASPSGAGLEFSNLKNQVNTANKYQPKTEPVISKPKPSRVSQAIRDKVTANGQLKAKHHLQSLLFGLGLGSLVIIVFLFSFFNQIIIAPLIQPSRDVTATPVIIGDGTAALSSTPEVIIPKINVEIPVDYTETSTNENVIENDLEGGVVHYPDTVEPGQTGNAAFFGHSSNNIFNPGKYKFAFVLLHTLVNGDTFYLTYNNTVYIYKVISHTVVSPSDVSVLGPVSGQTATATLITCDPPGTSINRLIVVGQQISPSPSTDVAPTNAVDAATTTNYLPGNGPSLWSRLISSTVGKVVSVLIVLVILGAIFRGLSKRQPY